MTSYWRLYFQRSTQVITKLATDIVLMKGADPVGKARTAFTFNTQAEIDSIATGCDGDNGGLSTANFTLNTQPEVNAPLGKPATGMFWGEMHLKVKPGMENKIRGGWAGFRNKNRPSIFGNILDDASRYDYLGLRLRAGGDPRTHNSYFVNVQTAGPIQSDLWQHRLYFQKSDNTWEDVYIPFHSFVRTNAGEMSEFQMEMMKENIRSVGISILGGNSGVEGNYEIGIDSIRYLNEEDMTEIMTEGENLSEKVPENEKQP